MIGMRQYPDKYFDLAIVDPPYGIGEDGKSNHSRGGHTKFGGSKSKAITASTQFTPKEWDKNPMPKEYFVELFRVSKNQIVWGANHFIENMPLQNSSCWVVWDKINGKCDQADCELAWGSFNSSVRKFSFRWHGMLQGDMRHKEKRIHPTQKPVQLYEWLLKHYAKPGQKILDTHLGSGSSRIAASNLGFDFWGYEIDREYFDDQETRFKAGTESTIFTDIQKPKPINLFNL